MSEVGQKFLLSLEYEAKAMPPTLGLCTHRRQPHICLSYLWHGEMSEAQNVGGHRLWGDEIPSAHSFCSLYQEEHNIT